MLVKFLDNTLHGKAGEIAEIPEEYAIGYGNLVEIVKKGAISDDNSKNDTEQAKEEKNVENSGEKMPKKQNKAI